MKILPLPQGKFALRPPSYSPATRAACFVVPGFEWDATTKQAEGYPDAIEVGADWLHRHKGLFEIKLPFSPPKSVPMMWRGWGILREYQSTGVHFLVNASQYEQGAILADDMGLGKTLTTLAASRLAEFEKVIIVCPNYVRGVWTAEHQKWLPNEPAPFLPEGTKAPAIPEGVSCIVIHYDILHAWENELRKWVRGSKTLIGFDECHYLTGQDSRRSLTAKRIRGECHTAWGLSGTPLTNRPRDLWNVVDTIFPGRFGENFFAYGRRYCDGKKVEVAKDKIVWNFDGSSHEEELKRRLSYFMLRRTKGEVALELPPKTRQVIRIPIKARLPSLATSRREMRALLDAACDVKLDAVWAVLKDHLDSGAKVVAFTWRRGVAEWLREEATRAGYPSFAMMGGVSSVRRSKAIHEARECPGAHLLTATIDSSATGIDLSYATVGAFVELTHEPHECLQAESRLHRFGARAPTLIQYFIGSGTADEIILSHVISKLDVFESVIGDTGEKFKGTFAQSHKEIMSELYASLGFKP